MEQLEQAEEKLKEASRLVREAVDLSLEVMCRDVKPNQEVACLWEDFLGDFLRYIQMKGKEKKRNLFAAISFNRVWRRI
ncbi:MAG: hypothetical protein VR68_00585 [Peptococcaceae bacterium BRH_c4a]|nr:MAG: hypothetical protein VR68_00585 [Peptococcaceae bacterium BRH_c4a]